MKALTWRGPGCIDAVGAEAHAPNDAKALVDAAKKPMHLQSDRPYVLQEAIMACRPCVTVSVPGVYTQTVTLPFGAAMNEGLTFKMGQTRVQRYLDPLPIQGGEIDPALVITHMVPLDRATEVYETFRDKEDDCTRVVPRP